MKSAILFIIIVLVIYSLWVGYKLEGQSGRKAWIKAAKMIVPVFLIAAALMGFVIVNSFFSIKVL